MPEQQELIQNPHRAWVLSEEARRAGLAGVRAARAALHARPEQARRATLEHEEERSAA